MTAQPEKKHSQLVRALFNRKAANWSSKYGARGPLAWRVTAFASALEPLVSTGASILDFGCGAGDIANALSRCGYRVTACDIAEDMVAQCRSTFGDRIQWTTLSHDWSSLPFEDGAFSGIVASSVLEYVTDIGLVFREWARVLQPRGSLIASVPNSAHPVRHFETALAMLGRTAAVASLIERRAGALGSYAAYLRLSRNRLRVSDWVAAASPHGFSLSRIHSRGALLLLSFLRSG